MARALRTLLDRHIGKACAAAGIAPAGIGDALGDHAMSTVFGVVFGDLLALDLPDGRNLADWYLRRRGPWRGLAGVEFATLEWVDLVQHSPSP